MTAGGLNSVPNSKHFIDQADRYTTTTCATSISTARNSTARNARVEIADVIRRQEIGRARTQEALAVQDTAVDEHLSEPHVVLSGRSPLRNTATTIVFTGTS